MAVIKDPEGNDIAALQTMVDFKDISVLEIGCGEGRLTWRYASEAAQVTAIDPKGEAIESARVNTPRALRDKVRFLKTTLADFAGSFSSPRFDLVIFSWSL